MQQQKNLEQQPECQPIRRGSVLFAWSLRICLLVVILGLISWAWAFLHDPWKFPVKSVQVKGNYQQLDSAELKQLVLPYVNQGFFAVPVTALRQRIMELPWVADVAVKRIWPTTVIIDIIEQVPVAHWGSDSLLNAQAKIFTPSNAAEITGLPFLSGPKGQQQQVLKNYKAMNEILASLNLKVVRLIMTPRHTWQIILNNQLELMLSKADALARLQRFVEVYPQLQQAQSQEAAYVDLRYVNGISIRWQNTNS